MRVIGAQVSTVGELLDALAECDPNTAIRWYASDFEDVCAFGVETAEVDATSHSVDIQVRAR